MGLNPHIFRNIVPTYYYSQTKNNTYASLYLMHKPKDFTDTDLVYIDFDYNDVVKDVNQVLVKLCKSNCRRNKTEKNIDNNVIQFKK